jgi:hypothetical protein
MKNQDEELVKKTKAIYDKALQLKHISNDEQRKELLSDIKYMSLLVCRGVYW